MSTSENEIIEEDKSDPLRDAQNQIISSIILFLLGLVLYITIRDDSDTAFEFFMILFLITNSLYFLYRVFKYLRLIKMSRES